MTQRTPIPFVQSPPRDGLFQETFPGSNQVQTEGTLRNGLREGPWKTYHPNGQLKSECEWSQGILDGIDCSWFPSGEPDHTGRNLAGKRTEKWSWFYENGGLKEASTYVNGKREGEYVWDGEDGQPLGRGGFSAERRHGVWTWWNGPNAAKVERTYWQGNFDGIHSCWDANGFLILSCPYWRNRKHGVEEHFYADGAPKFRGEWLGGNAVGEHLSWDADGKESLAVFVDGLPKDLSQNTKKFVSVVKKLTKAKDGYKKTDIFTEAAGHEGRGAFVLKLWRDGLYDVANDPEIWGTLLDATGLMKSEEIVSFLRTATNQGVHGRHLPYWSSFLDELVMHAYELDPGPFSEGWKDLPEQNKKGVAFVMARFGKDVADVLRGEIDALLTKHIDQYGFDEQILWPIDGRVRSVKLAEAGERTEYFQKFLDLFVTKEEWISGLRKRAEADKEKNSNRISFRQYRDLVEVASVDELTDLVDGIALDGATHVLIQTALTQWRQLSGDDLTKIALALKDTGLRKWPALCVAVLKLHQEGQEIPDALVDAFILDAESPTFSSEWFHAPLRAVDEKLRDQPAYKASFPEFGVGCAVPRSKMIHDALAVLPNEAVRRIFERYWESPYYKSYVAPYAYRLEDSELWRRVIEVLDADSYGDGPRYSWEFVGNIGLPAVPIIEELLHGLNPKLQTGLAQGIVVALAQAASRHEAIPETYDKHVQFSGITADYNGQFMVPFFARLIHLLPTQRAEKLLIAGLKSPQFPSALGMIGSHPTQAVLKTAFHRLLDLETTLSGEAKGNVRVAVQGLPNPQDWIRWIFANGGGGGIKEALTQAVGRPEFDRIFAEITQNVAPPKELDHIDKLLALTADITQGEQIYVLRRLEKEAPKGSLNVIGGAAPGTGNADWPMYDDEPMAHLFTIDFMTMPELRLRYPGARAMSVFCYQPEFNEAWTPANGWTAVRFVTDAEVAAKPAPHDEAPETERTAFEVVSLLVPYQPKKELSNAIYGAGARIGGDPIWLQSEEYEGDFVMQFDESFVPINLGDCGVMYVFSDTAFWQCH